MSTIAGVISLMSQTALFDGLDDADLAACAHAFKGRQFPKGHTLFMRGDPGDCLYLVESGRIRLAIATANDRRVSFRHAVEGDLFGEIAMLDGGPRTADATAITAVKVHSLERDAFRNLWATRPALARRWWRFCADGSGTSTTQFQAVALEPLDVRLARFLLSALGSRSAPPGKRIPLELGFSQSELSQLLAASRSKVNIAMGSLEKAGALSGQT